MDVKNMIASKREKENRTLVKRQPEAVDPTTLAERRNPPLPPLTLSLLYTSPK